jgi:hypothetical protein
MSADEPADGGDATGPAKGGDVMSSLPRTRPQRPSRRRASAGGGRSTDAKGGEPQAAKPAGARAKSAAGRRRAAAARPKPAGVRPSAATKAASRQPPPKPPPSPPTGTDLVGTAVQAAGELAELGLTLGARALRDAVKRLPRP